MDTTDYKNVVNILIESNADPNAQGGHFTTAVLAIVGYGHEGLAVLLVDRRASLDVNGANDNLKTRSLIIGNYIVL